MNKTDHKHLRGDNRTHSGLDAILLILLQCAPRVAVATRLL